MEEDDDFGELYSDVLLPFSINSDQNIKPPISATSPPSPNSKATPFQIRHPIDLNIADTDSNEIDNIHSINKDRIDGGKIEGLGIGVERNGELDSGARVLGESSFMNDDDDIDVVVEERDDKDQDFIEKDDNLMTVDGNLDCSGIGNDLNFNEESESDSEDDLQIVLNNDNEVGVMGMGGMREDEEEDGEPLVILGGDDGLGSVGMMENREWGEDGGAGIDGEKKEIGEGIKVNGGVAVHHPKVPYGNNAFHHPFHSQFKYVRPGVAPMAGPVPPGPGGINGQVYPPAVGPIPGRGRGDWRPSGIKGAPIMQKGFHPGYGPPAWGSNSAGRGLDFTLPSHKTIFEVDIDSFEDKPWRLPGIDMSDFFNFGLNEEGWKEYCKQLEQHRLETTMQSRIRTYESVRAEQDYDPDLPPELAAASGAQGISSENITLVTTDPGQDASIRPTGRPIQVETNYTDRLPSIDARQSRMRDSDAIIEIKCQGSTDEGSPEADMVEPENEQLSDEDLARVDGVRDMSPRKGTSESTREKQSADDQNEKSYESIEGGKHSCRSLSPESDGAAMEQDVETRLSIPDEPGRGENSPESEREALDLEITSQDDMVGEEDLLHFSEKQKSNSKVELSHETDEGFRNSREAIDKVEGSAHMSKMKRSTDIDDNMIRRKGYSERKDAGRRHISTKGEESYAHQGLEHNYANRVHAKTNGADPRRESDNSRRTRVEDTRLRSHVDEIGSRHRNKVGESDRSEKDEHLDIGSRRGNPDKVMGSKRNRDDGIKRRDGSIDSLHNKRRKEDGTQRREQSEKEIISYGNRNSSSRRKREIDDVSDERKPRMRDERYKEEGLFQRQRDRDEWQRVKHVNGEMLSKREREDVRSGMNSIRAPEEKVWSSHSRVKDEFRGSDRDYYQKDVAQPKWIDRTENENFVQSRGREDIYAPGDHHRSDGRRAKRERVSSRDDRSANASDIYRGHERKPKEYPRKGKEHEAGYPNLGPHSIKKQDERTGLKTDMANSKGELEHGNRSSSAKLNEEGLSDDEQHNSRRGRSKLERWGSHKERDFSANAKSSSSSLQIQEPETKNSSGPSLAAKVPNDHPKAADDKHLSAIKDKEASETNNADGKPVDNKHGDTVEKLKKRSERFKLPMPGEKEITASKKVENDHPPPPPSQPELRPDVEIKSERPARKRRWTSN